MFIDACQTRTETIDAVGQCGGPVADAGFQITVAGNEIGIGPGRYYVNGLLCDNPTSLSYEEQPYLSLPGTAPDAAVLLSGLNVAAGALVIQVWLQVWQRLQTALDDPCLLEPRSARPTPLRGCRRCGARSPAWCPLPSRRPRARVPRPRAART